jgi:hypothetical protein
MSRQILELETLLRALVGEHKKLLTAFEHQQQAMRAFDVKMMEDVGSAQEACRMRISTLETKRRALVAQLARGARLAGQPNVSQLAELFPERKAELLRLRTELRDVVQQVATRTHVAGRVAGAVLGHLNTVVRLIAGAVEQAGLYTKHGTPHVAARIGVLEAVA